MSNRPKRSARPGRAPAAGADDRRRNLLVVLGVVAVVVVVGVVVALGAAEDDASDAPDFGPVVAEGEALPELPEGAPEQVPDPAVGTTAPRVDGLDPDGEGVTIAAGGEPTLAVFLAHWCGFCQREVPEIVELMGEGELEGVRVVAVLTGTDRRLDNYPPVAWLEREGWEGEILLDDDEASAAAAYGLSAYPFAVYLDADGEVVSRTSGGRGRDAILEQVELLRAAG